MSVPHALAVRRLGSARASLDRSRVNIFGHMEKLAARTRRGGARRAERGYSLLEVLIVLTIIALVAALVGPRLIAQLDRSKVTAARVQVRTLASALETMRIDIGRYPTTQEGLALLVTPPTGARESAAWAGPYLDSDVPADPWGGAFTYDAPREDFARPRIASLGADGEVGGAGLAADIVHGDAAQ